MLDTIDAFSVESMSHLILINMHGHVQAKSIGTINMSVLRENLSALISDRKLKEGERNTIFYVKCFFLEGLIA